MRAASAHSRTIDPYRAGLELGASLQPLSPEVVFLFTSVHYIGSDRILDGLYDGLGRDDVVVLGTSGDGYYETRGVGEFGACALGLDSGGSVRWHLVQAGGVGADPEGTTRRAFAAAHAAMAGREPALYYLLSDFRTDATRLESVIEQEITTPVIGGLAVDDSRLQDCVLYANRQRLTDHIVLLAIDGPLHFTIHVANTMPAIGRQGIVETTEGALLQRVSGVSAREFVERESGKAVVRSDPGTRPLAFRDADDPEVQRLRSVLGGFGESGVDAQGALALYGSIAAGKHIQVCEATPELLLADIARIAAEARAGELAPVAALMTSCAGRKLVLGTQMSGEADNLLASFPELPIAGYPSAGEIGPVRTSHGYSRNLFHNMTCIVLLIGA